VPGENATWHCKSEDNPPFHAIVAMQGSILEQADIRAAGKVIHYLLSAHSNSCTDQCPECQADFKSTKHGDRLQQHKLCMSATYGVKKGNCAPALPHACGAMSQTFRLSNAARDFLSACSSGQVNAKQLLDHEWFTAQPGLNPRTARFNPERIVAQS
jgi:hypothetical protein